MKLYSFMMLPMKNLLVFSLLLVITTCQKDPKNVRKVLHGDIVNDTDKAPWVVSVRNSKDHQCSGTLISQKHVLTAGHCFLSENATDFWTFSGEIWDKTEGCSGTDLIVPPRIGDLYTFNFKSICGDCKEIQIISKKAKKIVLPGICVPNRSKNWWETNDIAIIELDEELPISDSFKPAKIGNYDLKLETQVMIMGYGDDPSDNSTSILKNGWTRDGIIECEIEEGVKLSKNDWFCSKNNPGDQMGCDGDSGAGAVVYNYNDEVWNIVGIFVKGSDCKPSENGYNIFVGIRKHVGDICKHTGVC